MNDKLTAVLQGLPPTSPVYGDALRILARLGVLETSGLPVERYKEARSYVIKNLMGVMFTAQLDGLYLVEVPEGV